MEINNSINEEEIKRIIKSLARMINCYVTLTKIDVSKQRNAEWCLANPEKKKASIARYESEHREERNEYRRRWLRERRIKNQYK